MFKRFYNRVYTLPALFLHELTHIVVAYLLGSKLKSVDIVDNGNKGYSILLNMYNFKNIFCVRLVAMSPFLIPAFLLGFIFFVDTSFVIGFIYSLSVFKTTFPSKTDFKTSKFKYPNFIK